MIYIKHDFYSNFNNSLASGDTDFTQDIFADELSDCIVYNLTETVSLLNSADLKASEKQSDEEILDLILNNINTNVKLQKAMAFLIAKKNKLITDNTSKKTGTKIIDGIYTAVAPTFKLVNLDGNKKSLFKDKVMGLIKTKAGKIKDRKRDIEKPSHILRNTLIVVGLLATAYLIYRYRKQIVSVFKKDGNTQVAGSGMEVSASTEGLANNLNPEAGATDSFEQMRKMNIENQFGNFKK